METTVLQDEINIFIAHLSAYLRENARGIRSTIASPTYPCNAVKPLTIQSRYKTFQADVKDVLIDWKQA